MSAILGFDPFQVVSEVAVISAVAITLLLAWKHRHRVMVAITGDDRIHGTSLDFVWFVFFNCCGCCTGDWTRCLTRCPCCPKRVRGANLVKLLGQCLGFTTYTVELKNIVVGDLPFDRRGDFYLVVECAANPPMMSSLAEEKLPKVVHFPEIITLRVRWSPLEDHVRITVKELNVLGSESLCSCHISAMHVLDWSEDPNEKMKRFEMKPTREGLQSETPAWILLEFDQPMEARDLEHFHGNVNTVRTATRDGHYKDTSLSKFKREYVLLDSSGHAMEEAREEDLQDIANLRACASWLLYCSHCLTFSIFVSFLCCRAYVWSCYSQYWRLTMAWMRHAHFPINTGQLKQLVHACYLEVQGTGVQPGIPCRPNTTNVLEFAAPSSQGGHFPEEQPRPSAFAGVTSQRLGIQVGIPCIDGVCELHDAMKKLDVFVICGCVALVLFGCLCQACMNHQIRERRRAKQLQKLEETRMVHERMSQRRGAFSSLF
mmetsp:Transcript_77066/g.249389  ORF Transcript_77066/g.249389 Transcript_77066/m.249389 type:complete len:487 (-) Transcript_77066:113-1573(-)